MRRIQKIYLTSFTAIVLLFSFGCGGSSDEVKYVALGASDATGIGAEPITDGYVYLINDRLEGITEGSSLTNLGIPAGETAEFLRVEVPIAIELDPDLITLWAGPNDIISGVSAEEFRSNLDEIINKLTQKTSAFIVIGTIPNLTDLPRFAERPDEDVTVQKIRDYNGVIRELATKYNVAVADLSKFQPTDTLVSDRDGFHPSNSGHQLLASLFLEVIEPVFSNSETNSAK